MVFLERSFVLRAFAELEGDEHSSTVASGVEEARKLLEVGFEYICTHKDEMLFRKRK
jgi:hypothetical protein